MLVTINFLFFFQCTYPCFHVVRLSHNIYCPSHWLLFHITFVKTIDSCKSRMNPIRMTIINPRKIICQDRNQISEQPLVLAHSHTTTPFDTPFETSLLKTLWEKEKLPVTSNFSFSYSVFYLFG